MFTQRGSHAIGGTIAPYPAERDVRRELTLLTAIAEVEERCLQIVMDGHHLLCTLTNANPDGARPARVAKAGDLFDSRRKRGHATDRFLRNPADARNLLVLHFAEEHEGDVQ